LPLAILASGESEFVMSTTAIEKHYAASDIVRHVVIGMADGLSAPFVPAAGLAPAVSTTSVIVAAGLWEIAVGTIAMRLGGYLAARSDAVHFASGRARGKWQANGKREFEVDEVTEVLVGYGLDGDAQTKFANAIAVDPRRRVESTMPIEPGFEEPNPK
jgi:hypothetical protein